MPIRSRSKLAGVSGPVLLTAPEVGVQVQNVAPPSVAKYVLPSIL